MPPHWKKDRRRALANAMLAGRLTAPRETGTEQESVPPIGNSAASRWTPGQSGNPGGRPPSDRAYLRQQYRADGAVLFERLEDLRNAVDTPAELRFAIDRFLVERLFGPTQ